LWMIFFIFIFDLYDCDESVLLGFLPSVVKMVMMQACICMQTSVGSADFHATLSLWRECQDISNVQYSGGEVCVKVLISIQFWGLH